MSSVASSVTTGTKGMFEGDVEKAKEEADFTIHVNPDRPENNMAPLFWVQEHDNQDTPDKMAVYTKLRILCTHIMDVRNKKHIKGQVICGGRVFWVRMPIMPLFLLLNFAAMFDKDAEKESDETIKKNFAVEANKIIQDAERMEVTFCFVMEEGTLVTANLNSNDPPSVDQRAEFRLKDFTVTTHQEAGRNGKLENVGQTFLPGWWNLRVLEDKESALTLAESNDSEDLAAALKRMAIKKKKNGMQC